MSETGTDAAPGSRVETDGVPDDLSQARDEAERLTTRILELRDQYYEGNGSTVADADYDGLVRRLDALERAHPELQKPDSPTQTVGGRAETTQFAHAQPRQRVQRRRAGRVGGQGAA
jgi:DNA ligase (NAD+)